MQRYAIAEIAGYQYRIIEGSKVTVPRLDTEVGETVIIDKVLLVNVDGKVSVGAPFVDGAKVEAMVLEHKRSRKVRVFKKKRRKGYRRTASARQYQTTLEVKGLSA